MRCWSCGAEHDSYTMAFDDEDTTTVPRNGDLSFCFSCGAFAIYDDSFVDEVRKPTPSENHEIRTDKTLMSVRRKWALIMQMTEQDLKRERKRR